MIGHRILRIAILLCMVLGASGASAQKVELSLDASTAGAKTDRNIFGEFAEYLGHGIYDGIWVGPDAAIPNTRGIRNDVVTALNDHYRQREDGSDANLLRIQDVRAVPERDVCAGRVQRRAPKIGRAHV